MRFACGDNKQGRERPVAASDVTARRDNSRRLIDVLVPTKTVALGRRRQASSRPLRALIMAKWRVAIAGVGHIHNDNGRTAAILVEIGCVAPDGHVGAEGEGAP